MSARKRYQNGNVRPFFENLKTPPPPLWTKCPLGHKLWIVSYRSTKIESPEKILLYFFSATCDVRARPISCQRYPETALSRLQSLISAFSCFCFRPHTRTRVSICVALLHVNSDINNTRQNIVRHVWSFSSLEGSWVIRFFELSKQKLTDRLAVNLDRALL